MDLNPIEYLWKKRKRRIKDHRDFLKLFFFWKKIEETTEIFTCYICI